MDRRLYPHNWRKISESIRHRRAKGRCEWCNALNGFPHPNTGSMGVLTVAHLGAPWPDGRAGDKADKHDCRAENLAALCQSCHLAFDRSDNQNTARTKREQRQLIAEPMLPGFAAVAIWTKHE